MRSVCIIGLVCLLPAVAHASAESTTEESKTKHGLLERRVFLPSSSRSRSTRASTCFELAPRVGYLLPLAGELYLWPRISAGALFGEASAPGFPTSSVAGMHFAADVLLVAGLGSHFFLTIGPHGSVTAAWQQGLTSTSFGVGANVGLGVAL